MNRPSAVPALISVGLGTRFAGSRPKAFSAATAVPPPGPVRRCWREDADDSSVGYAGAVVGLSSVEGDFNSRSRRPAREAVVLVRPREPSVCQLLVARIVQAFNLSSVPALLSVQPRNEQRQVMRGSWSSSVPPNRSVRWLSEPWHQGEGTTPDVSLALTQGGIDTGAVSIEIERVSFAVGIRLSRALG